MFLLTISALLFCNSLTQIRGVEQLPTPKTKASNFNGRYDECVCFPAGQSLVPGLLNPNGLERLTVFLYRDVNTKQIKMFVPGPEKQALIPNLPFEVGDVLKTVTTDTISSVFSTINGPNQYQRNKEAPSIGLKWGTIEQHGNSNSNSVLQRYPIQGNIHESFPREIYFPDKKQHVTLAHKNNYAHITNIKKTDAWQSKNPYQSFKPLNPIRNSPFMRSEVNLPTYKQDVYAPEANQNPGEVTFDQWFDRQMTTYKDAISPGDIKTINTDVMRTLVQKALFENHMLIGATGVITDPQGKQINLNDLELRPVLVGNAVTFQQTLTAGQQLLLPKNLPYLEGLLISLIHPPKILGVVPLGKINVSQHPQATQPRALIDHYYTERVSVPNDVAGSNLLNPSNSIPLHPSMDVAPVGGVSYSSSVSFGNPQTDGIWKRRANKSSRKPKAKAPKQSRIKSQEGLKQPNGSDNLPKSADNLPKKTSWFSNIFSRSGRKSGNRFYDWQTSSNSAWKYPVAVNAPSSTYPWSSQISSSDHRYYLDHRLKPNLIVTPRPYIPRSGFSDRNWQSHSGLIASPYSFINQSTYYPYEIAQPIPMSPSYAGAAFPLGSQWHQFVATTEYPFIARPAVKSPYLRSEPDPDIIKTPPHAGIPIEIPSKILIESVTEPVPTIPEFSHATEVPTSSIVNHTQGLSILSSVSIQNQTKPLGGTRRFPLPVIQGVLKTLINMVLQNLTQGNRRVSPIEADLINALPLDSRSNNPNHIQKNGDLVEEEGDQPDFRIIGGSPATGSGSPLSNKGRSGLHGV